MNLQTEKIVDEHKTTFPSTKGFSAHEAFINTHSVITDGALWGDEHDYTFAESNLDFSEYFGVIIDISMGSLDPYCFHKGSKRGLVIEKDFLQQSFFDELVADGVDKPELLIEEYSDFHQEKSRVKRGKTASIDCTFYPICPMERSLLYKVDVAVKISPKVPLLFPERGTECVVGNFFQKYFIVDNEGLFFEQQAKNALKQCFKFIPGAFSSTKDRKVYIVKEYDWRVFNQDKKAADYEPSASK